MIIGDYIKNKLSIWSVDISAEMIDAELERLQLSSSETMTAETNIDRFFYNVIPDILLMPKSVSEGGYSVSYDASAMKAYYSMIAKRLGLPDQFGGNQIIDITNRW